MARFEAEHAALMDALTDLGHVPEVKGTWRAGEGGGPRAWLECTRCGERRRRFVPERWQLMSRQRTCRAVREGAPMVPEASGTLDGPTLEEMSVFFGRNTRDHQLMPAGGPDPSAQWGRRYERVRDEIIDRYIADAHQPEVWRFQVNSGEGGWVWWSLVRCARCDHRSRIHRFPLAWVRYRGTRCVPLTAGQLEDLVADKRHREARTGWLTIGTILALLGITVAGGFLTDDFVHPMLGVTGLAAGIGGVYFLLKAIRQWNRP
jgi:hypothetical protein